MEKETEQEKLYERTAKNVIKLKKIFSVHPSCAVATWRNLSTQLAVAPATLHPECSHMQQKYAVPARMVYGFSLYTRSFKYSPHINIHQESNLAIKEANPYRFTNGFNNPGHERRNIRRGN